MRGEGGIFHHSPFTFHLFKVLLECGDRDLEKRRRLVQQPGAHHGARAAPDQLQNRAPRAGDRIVGIGVRLRLAGDAHLEGDKRFGGV